MIFFFQRTIMNDPLKLLPVDVTKIRAQDVVVVAAVLVALFLFRAPNVWELKPSWQLDDILHSDHHTTRNKLYVWLSDFFMKLLWQAHCHLNNSVKIQVHSFKFITYLTLYTLKSVYIFSILFSIHFLRCWQGEFVYQSKDSFLVDHFLYSHDLNMWFRGDIIGRNLMLVKG